MNRNGLACDDVDWIDTAHDKVHRKVPFSMIMNEPYGPIKGKEFLEQLSVCNST
jgi:hypothetical protein